MQLDYEDIGEAEETTLRAEIDMCHLRFVGDSFPIEKRYALFELVVKPALDIRQDSRILEIGVGTGNHLGSFIGLDYVGMDTDLEALKTAQQQATLCRMTPRSILKKGQGSIPLGYASVGRIFSVATLHEAENIPGELREMHRVLKPKGRIVLVERLCALSESPRAMANLVDEQTFLPKWFTEQGYSVEERRFKATYYGESLSGSPLFNFYSVIAQRLEAS